MKTSLECIPCFLHQALDSIRRVCTDELVCELLLRQVCHEVAEMDLSVPPPVMGGRIQRLVREMTGIADPYLSIKQQFNRHALALYPMLREQVGRAADPLALAVRFAIAGNRIDFGVAGGTSEAEVGRLLHAAATQPVAGSVEALRQAVQEARQILYLADNAGEIVLDRLLIEQLPQEKITLAVRGRPVLNDVTREDAEGVGLADLVEVIDNGSDLPGTALEVCSADFQARFAAADLVIAKGQGNYETLDQSSGKRIFFLLMVKCPKVAAGLDQPQGTFVVHDSQGVRPVWR